MDKNTVALRVRERLDAGTLPRAIPPLTTEPGRPTSPVGTIKADTASAWSGARPAMSWAHRSPTASWTAASSDSTADATGSGKWSVNGVRCSPRPPRATSAPARGSPAIRTDPKNPPSGCIRGIVPGQNERLTGQWGEGRGAYKSLARVAARRGDVLALLGVPPPCTGQRVCRRIGSVLGCRR